MLELKYDYHSIEAGCDEAGRGCLAGPVFAAAVILPDNFSNELLNDSKQLSEKQRAGLRPVIEREALAWAVASVDNHEIDKINILNASILAMHRALDQLKVRPGHIIVDGNRFKKYRDIPHLCIVKGDGKYMSIAAASVLAKTHRDEYMENLHALFPVSAQPGQIRFRTRLIENAHFFSANRHFLILFSIFAEDRLHSA